MTIPDRTLQIGEETRAALTDRAAAASRRNQPRFLIVGAAGLLAVAGVMALFGISSRVDASSRYSAEEVLTRRVEDLVAQIAAIDAREKALIGNQVFENDEGMYTKIEAIGRDEHMGDIRISQGNDAVASSAESFVKKKYSLTNMSQQETENLLNWVARVTTELHGVQLSQIDLDPDIATLEGKPRWKGSIAFTRWERGKK